MDAVIGYYENYDEDGRLSRDHVHKIEFLTTTHFLDQYIKPDSSILDVGAGTGAYSFYLAEKGHSVTAIDITPKNVQQMTTKLHTGETKLDIDISVGDARDLSRFRDEQFDVVLCMGPLYHLIDLHDREKCIHECTRVLKKGGVLVLAYINRIGVFTHLVKQNPKFLESSYFQKIVERGYILSNEKECFWTDAYFSSPEEMEKLAAGYNIDKINNLAADGIGCFTQSINSLTSEEFDTWMQYHYKICSEPSIIGMSIHGLYVGRKE